MRPNAKYLAVALATLSVLPVIAAPPAKANMVDGEILIGASYGPVRVALGKTLTICAANIFGEAAIDLRLLLFYSPSATVPASIPMTIRPRETKCYSIAGKADVTAFLGLAPVSTWNTPVDWRMLATSGIVADADGNGFALVPTQHMNLPVATAPSSGGGAK